MPYNFVADSFHTKKLCSRLSSSKIDFRWKTAVLHLWASIWGLARRTMFMLCSLESRQNPSSRSSVFSPLLVGPSIFRSCISGLANSAPSSPNVVQLIVDTQVSNSILQLPVVFHCSLRIDAMLLRHVLLWYDFVFYVYFWEGVMKDNINNNNYDNMSQFHVLHFHVLQFHILHFHASLLGPSFSRPAFSASLSGAK